MPKITTAKISETDKADILSATERVLIKSNLECFKQMNGIRPGEFSVIVGKQGNGKSSLCKTISFEAAVSGINTLFILSEEKSSVYKKTINNAFVSQARNNADAFLNRIYFDSILDWEPREKNFDFFFSHLEEMINELKTDLIIFDNFTTSFLGSLPISKQGEAIDSLRLLAADYDIAIVGVFHTTKGTDIYSKVLDGEDVRGNATSTNSGSYNFILTTLFRANPPRAFLFVDKARYHKSVNKTYWELNYDVEYDIYTKSRKTDYVDIQVLLKELNNQVNEKRKEYTKNLKGW